MNRLPLGVTLRYSAVAVIAGVFHAFSLAWPFAWLLERGQTYWWMQLLAQIAWAHALTRTLNPKEATCISWCFGFASLASGTAWLHEAMYVYGGMPWLLSVLGVVALAAFLALYYGIMGALWSVFIRSGGVTASVLFATAMLGGELARGQWLGGFGWGSGAYAHAQGPWSAWQAVGGAYWVVFLVGGWCMALAQWCANPSRRSGWVVLAWFSVGLTGWLVPTRLEQGHGVTVALAQGNIAQSEKFEPSTGVELALAWYRETMLAASAAEVVIAPETALPILPSQLPPHYWTDLDQGLREAGRAAFVGIPMGNYEVGYTNSVAGLGGAQGYRYDKHHLVPFGEFIPPFFHWFMRLMHIPLGDFSRGDLAQPSALVAGVRWGIQVCFEDVFSEEIAARFVDPALGPQVLVNVSNLAWFGDSMAPYQHLNIARVRSMELGRPTVRVANTGITSIIDENGQVQSRLPPFERGVLRATVVPVDGVTPYARWASRWGQSPLWLLVGVVFTVAWYRRAKGRT